MRTDKKNADTVFVINKNFFIYIISVASLFGIACFSIAIFTLMYGGEPNIPSWAAKGFPFLFIPIALAFQIPSLIATITITDRLIEIGKMPAFEKSEISKVSVYKLNGILPVFSIVEFEFRDAAKMARVSKSFMSGKYMLKGYIAKESLKTLQKLNYQSNTKDLLNI